MTSSIFLICVKLVTVTAPSVCPAVSLIVLSPVLHFSPDKGQAKEECKSYSKLRQFVNFPVKLEKKWKKEEDVRRSIYTNVQ